MPVTKRNRSQAVLCRLARVVLWFMALGLALALSGPAVRADTQVGGPIVSDTTWTLANSPYVVVASIDVWEGVTLTIEPGVVVKLQAEKKIQVNGTLAAQGNASQNIVFTSAQASPQVADWGQIEFTDTSVDAAFDPQGHFLGGSILQHCIVEYGGNGVRGRDGTIQTDDASPFIDHCTIRYNTSSGIAGVGTAVSPMRISNNVIHDNTQVLGDIPYGGGIYGQNLIATGNAIHGNSIEGFASYGGGIYAEDSLVADNAVYGNSALSDGDVGGDGGGIAAIDSQVIGNSVTNNYVLSGDIIGTYGAGISATRSTVSNNIIRGNIAEGRPIYYHGGYGAGLYGYSCVLTDNLVAENVNKGTYSQGGGIYARYSSVRGNTIAGNANTAWRSDGGGIYANDSDLGGNVILGNATTGNGGGAYLGWDITVVTNTIAFNQVSTEGEGAGLYIGSSSSEIISNTVVANTGPLSTLVGGVAIEGTPVFHYNNLFWNRPYDVVIVSSENVDGTYNYWGTAESVNILVQVYDWYDDTERGKLLYVPYLQDPHPDAPVPPPVNLTGDWQDGSVVLRWDPIPSATTGYGYKVYYDTDEPGPPYEGTGLDQGGSPIDVGDLTEYTLTGFDPNATYYAAVTAYDTLGREGWYSNVINSLRRLYLPLILK